MLPKFPFFDFPKLQHGDKEAQKGTVLSEQNQEKFQWSDVWKIIMTHMWTFMGFELLQKKRLRLDTAATQNLNSTQVELDKHSPIIKSRRV